MSVVSSLLTSVHTKHLSREYDKLLGTHGLCTTVEMRYSWQCDTVGNASHAPRIVSSSARHCRRIFERTSVSYQIL